MRALVFVHQNMNILDAMSWCHCYWGAGIMIMKSREKYFLIITFLVLVPKYSGITRSITWLLMSWLIASPGHQQPWYWLCRINRSLSCMRKDFNYCTILVLRGGRKCKGSLILLRVTSAGQMAWMWGSQQSHIMNITLFLFWDSSSHNDNL